jgi:hypothetical protein
MGNFVYYILGYTLSSLVYAIALQVILLLDECQKCVLVCVIEACGLKYMSHFEELLFKGLNFCSRHIFVCDSI